MNSTIKPSWDYFPISLCINLKDRHDRLLEARAEFAKVGLKNTLFYRSEKQPDRDKAIIDAHMACLEKLVESGAPFGLIFEDDVEFLGDSDENLARVLQFLEKTPDWKIFHMGGLIFKKAGFMTPQIAKGGLLNVHAYVIRTDFAKEILELRKYCTGMSIDLYYTVLLGDNAYGHIRPQMCVQRASESDGSWDKNRVNSSGWLSKAMIFTGLPFREKLRYDGFPLLEKIKITNGMQFFKVYRWVLRRKFLAAKAKGLDVSGGPGPRGEFTTGDEEAKG